jgi:4-hydroxybenzoate polyprenyltransferase
MTFSTPGVVRTAFAPFWILNSIGKGIKDFYEFLMFSSVFVGLAAIGMVYTSCFLQGLSLSYPITAIMFLTAYSVYNLNRKTDENEDAVNHQGRYAFTKQNESSLFISAVLAYGAAVTISVFYGAYAIFITLIPLIAGILYSIKWLPHGSRYRRLKDIPVVKNTVVAFAWSGILSLLPVSLNGRIPDEMTFIAFFMFFSYAFIASTIPDIRDLFGDAQAGIRTIPVLFGEHKTRKFLMGLNLISCLFLIGISISTLPLRITELILATMIYIHVCLALLGNLSLRKYVYDLLADGQYLFFGTVLFLLASTHIFQFH